MTPGPTTTTAALALTAACVLTGCHDAPPRPAPPPAAPAQASRALLAQAMTAAVARIDEARRLPTAAPVVDADAALADHLLALGLDPADVRPRSADDPPARDDLAALADDPDGVVGGVVGGVLGAPALGHAPGAGVLGGSLAPSTGGGDALVQLVGDSDGADPALLRRQTLVLRLRADLCRRLAIADGELDRELTALVTISVSPRGAPSVHVSDGATLTACLERVGHAGDLAPGASLTFQVTIPAP
jgi:hypothetical protein